MRIYAAADIHGKAERIRRIRQRISAVRPHLLILAGDISGLRSPRRILRPINALSVPVLYIRGNSDSKKIDRMAEDFPNLTGIHASRVLWHSIPITGIGGTIAIPFRSKISFDEASLFRRVEPLINSKTVLVVHPPPLGCLDAALGRLHVGSANLRRLIRALQPRLVVCGHIHECAGIATIGKTRVVNCAMSRKHDGALIEISPGRELRITMF